MSVLSKNFPKILFWSSMLLAQVLAFMLFKDLADLSQWVIQGSRETTMAIWYNRFPIAIVSIIALLFSSVVWIRTRAGVGWKGFDPTIGDIVGKDHIPVAVSRLAEAVPPISGTFAGDSESSLDVGVWVTQC